MDHRIFPPPMEIIVSSKGGTDGPAQVAKIYGGFNPCFEIDAQNKYQVTCQPLQLSSGQQKLSI